MDGGTDGWKTLRGCISKSVRTFGLNPVRVLPLDDLVRPARGELPSGLDEEAWILKIQLIRGR